jgi:hypothetical protein
MKDRIQRAIDQKRKARPVKSYLWHMELPYLNGFNGDYLEISTRILAVNLPNNMYSTEKESHGNSFWYYANGVDIGDVSIEVMEFEDGKTFEYFSYWQSFIGNQNGTFNPPVFYKKELNFFRLDAMKQKIMNDTYSGYFVSGISDIANDYESNDVVKYTITLTGDSVVHKNLAVKHQGNHASNDLTTGTSVENIFKDVVNKAKATMSSVYKYLE